MNNPLVSVIMPAYNAGLYIEESIRSVIRQTYIYWELIVVDDGSLDDTKDIVKLIALEDNRVKYIHQYNQRQGVARNNGITYSRGEYLSFLDADDIWYPNKIELQLITIMREQVDLVFADCEVFYDIYNKGITYPIYGSFKGRIDVSNGLNDILVRNYIPILTVLVTRSSVEDVGCFSIDMLIQNAEDYHLWLKLMLSGYTFFGMDTILAAYRVHAKAVTGVTKSKTDWIVHAKYDIIKLYPKYKIYLQNSIWETILLNLKNSGEDGQYSYSGIIENLEFFNLKVFDRYFFFLKSNRLSFIASKSFKLLYFSRKFLQKIVKI